MASVVLVQVLVFLMAMAFVMSQLPAGFVAVENNGSDNGTVHACMQPLMYGPCRGYFPRFFFNKDSSACEDFIYGGCQGNDNNFETMEACQKMCTNN